MQLFYIMLGGGIGAASRYGLGVMATRLFGSGFPYGTAVANLTGCLLVGFLFEIAERTHLISDSMRLFLITGFLGALTTFSAFALETVHSANSGGLALSVLNIVLTNTAGLGLVVAGIYLARMV